MSEGGSGAGSLLRYISSEVTRSYMLEHDQERYRSKREKMYAFMRIPRSVIPRCYRILALIEVSIAESLKNLCLTGSFTA